MTDLKSMEEGFSKLIPNDEGIAGIGERSDEIRKAHNRWKKEIRDIKKGQSLENMTYWEVASSCVSL